MKVEPVMGETLRFWVASETFPGQRHLVDLESGQCGCAAYVCNRRKHHAETGLPYRCKHILAAREYWCNECIQKVRELQLSQ